MTITVVTAVYNAIESGNRENLIRCVRSVAALKVPHEHLICDGASTDGTVELLRELEREVNGEEKKIGVENRCTKELSVIHNSSFTVHNSQALRVVSEPDTGIYNALNKGFRASQGEWLYVLGCDDEIVNPELLQAATTFGESKQSDIVSSPVFVNRVGCNLLSPCKKYLFAGGVCPHQGVLVRREAIGRIGLFDESYRLAADYDQLLRAMLNNVRIAWFDSAYTLYGTSGASSVPDRCYREFATVLSRVLGLSEEEGSRLVRMKLMPLRVILRLLPHPSPEVRHAARFHLARFFANALGLIGKNGALIWR